ncbi:MAG: GSCFA domain-containing protein [Candidatus Omnitrophica bacterium]|nr:GSCFA domain-containing protein [Candidatus Omnitrophota bacterium]
MGSCFALEIQKVLREKGRAVYPETTALRAGSQEADELVTSGLESVHFNTFTMLQEFEKAFGLWRQDPDDFWLTKRGLGGRRGAHFQDPYRRKVYAPSKEGILALTAVLDEAIRKGIVESDLYILTMGLTEVWKKKDNGRVACTSISDSGGGGKDQLTFYQSGFADNYANMKKIIELIREQFPSRHVVLTVSPVPLNRTFSKDDVFTATVENKAVLRALAGQLVREFENVHYFPSYEFCQLLERFYGQRVFESDGRHVRRPVVNRIMESFLNTYAASH